MTPRVVRPAHLALRGSGVTPKTFSPILRDGLIDADLTVRTPAGKVSPVINIKAGTFNRTSGKTDIQLLIPKGFTVEVVHGHQRSEGLTWVSITPEEAS